MDTDGSGQSVELDRRQNAESVLNPDKPGGGKTAMFHGYHEPLILAAFSIRANGVIPCRNPKSLRYA